MMRLFRKFINFLNKPVFRGRREVKQSVVILREVAIFVLERTPPTNSPVNSPVASVVAAERPAEQEHQGKSLKLNDEVSRCEEENEGLRKIIALYEELEEKRSEAARLRQLVNQLEVESGAGETTNWKIHNPSFPSSLFSDRLVTSKWPEREFQMKLRLHYLIGFYERQCELYEEMLARPQDFEKKRSNIARMRQLIDHYRVQNHGAESITERKHINGRDLRNPFSRSALDKLEQDFQRFLKRRGVEGRTPAPESTGAEGQLTVLTLQPLK